MIGLQLAMVLVLNSGVSEFPCTPEIETVIVTVEQQKGNPFPTNTTPGRQDPVFKHISLHIYCPHCVVYVKESCTHPP